jgi:hypothetical protein
VRSDDLGIYEYEGAHRWRNMSGPGARRYFYTGFWA